MTEAEITKERMKDLDLDLDQMEITTERQKGVELDLDQIEITTERQKDVELDIDQIEIDSSLFVNRFLRSKFSFKVTLNKS